LPDENFSKKPNNARKRPGKGKPTVKRPEKSHILFAVLPFFCHKKYQITRISKKKILQN